MISPVFSRLRQQTQMAILLLFCMAQTGFSQSSPDRDAWPYFRGPTRMGVAGNGDPAVKWGPETNLAWRTSLPGAGSSSPIVYGKHIYLTSYTGYQVPGGPTGSLQQLQRHLIALDRKSGRIVWQKSIPARLPEEESIRDHGYAANTPAADEKHVYAFLGKSGVFAFDHDGNQVWHADVGSGTHGWGTAASPMLHDDLVIINASVESESLIALEKSTGKRRWTAEGIKESWNTPILVDASPRGPELIVARHGDVLAFAPKTGNSLWSSETDIRWYMVPSGVSGDGYVFYLGGRSDTTALAVKVGGNGDVTKTHRIWTSKDGSNVTSPTYHDGHLYWVSNEGGIAYCAEAATGKNVYRTRLARFGQVYASPVLVNDRIYYVDRSGKAVVVAAKPEFELLATNDLNDGSRYDASPAVDGSRLLLRSNKFLYCIEPQQ